jgi:hypothetical protein
MRTRTPSLRAELNFSSDASRSSYTANSTHAPHIRHPSKPLECCGLIKYIHRHHIKQYVMPSILNPTLTWIGYHMPNALRLFCKQQNMTLCSYHMALTRKFIAQSWEMASVPGSERESECIDYRWPQTPPDCVYSGECDCWTSCLLSSSHGPGTHSQGNLALVNEGND